MADISAVLAAQRTLQRAEQGKPVGSQHLKVIATRLGVPAEEIIKPAAKQAEKEEHLIRLSPVKGGQLIEPLQEFLEASEIEYAFHLEPGTAAAELIAEVVEYCDDLLHVDYTKFLPPAARIRAIGALNDKLECLAKLNIGVFASENHVWEEKRHEIEGDALKEGGELKVWAPAVSTRLLIAFGPLDAPFLEGRQYFFQTKASVFETCAKANLRRDCHPDLIKKWLSTEFYAFYKKCWDEARACAAESDCSSAIGLI